MSAQPTLFDAPTATIPTNPTGPGNWLLDHLIAAGHLTETGLGRRARIRPCPKCKTTVLAGLDAEMCAFDAIVDPHPLTPLGEALALIEGRPTYALHKESRGYLLDPRDAGHIAHHPAGTRRREDVLREHRCGTDPPTPALVAPTTYAEASPPLPPGSPPPF